FTKKEAVVAHVKNQRIFGQAMFFQPGDYRSDAFIHTTQRLAILPVKVSKCDFSVIHMVHTMPTVPLLTYPVRDTIQVNRAVIRRLHTYARTAIGSRKVHWWRANDRHIFIAATVP